jgi:hypothetical protein
MPPRTAPFMRPLVRGQSGLAAWDCCVPGAEVEVGATGGVLQPSIVIKAATKAAIVVTSTNVLEIASGGELIMDQVALGRSCKVLWVDGRLGMSRTASTPILLTISHRVIRDAY